MASPGAVDTRATPASPAVRVLLMMAIAYTAYFAAAIAIPITAAALLYFLFSPIVNRLVRRRIPRPVAAFGLGLVLTAFVSVSIYFLSGPAIAWLEQAPANIQNLRARLEDEPNPLENIRQASDAVEQAVEEITKSDDDGHDEATSVEIVEPGLVDNLLEHIPKAVLSVGLTVLLTAFLLLSGDQIMHSLVSAGGTFGARRRIVRTARQIESDISRYLGTVALINTALALIVAAAMYLLGLPNPLLWGAAAGLLNFAPYLGPALCAFMIFLAGTETMHGLQAMLAPPLVYVLITTVEGQFVTPLCVGQRLKLSPVVILLSVVVIGWIWGLVGALMAVPLVASLRICLSNIPGADAIAGLLARK